eukprot:6214808-Pleurochrysis_carterae.AAC.4
MRASLRRAGCASSYVRKSMPNARDAGCQREIHCVDDIAALQRKAAVVAHHPASTATQTAVRDASCSNNDLGQHREHMRANIEIKNRNCKLGQLTVAAAADRTKSMRFNQTQPGMASYIYHDKLESASTDV